RIDFTLRSLLSYRHEEAIAELGVPLAERHAGEEAGFEGVGQQIIDTPRAISDHELFEGWHIEGPLEAFVAAELLGSVARLLQAKIGRFTKALRTKQRQVNRRPKC